jgi:hypothetical protein
MSEAAAPARRFPPVFYRTAAIASFLTVATTLMLIFLPDFFAPGDGFDARMRRVTETPYILRAWAYFIHPFLAFTAALGVALRLRRQAHLMLPGLLGFALWAATEAGQQTMTLFLFDPWRRAWLASDQTVRATMEVRTALYDGLWNASYNLLLVGILIGCICYAAAMLRHRGLTRIVGAFYAAAALLTLSFMVVEYGGPSLPAFLDRWLYPAFQPLARFLIGLWLWRNADEAAPIIGSRRE